jgi:hypothetical protein
MQIKQMKKIVNTMQLYTNKMSARYSVQITQQKSYIVP